jgi:hypothetical protein
LKKENIIVIITESTVDYICNDGGTLRYNEIIVQDNFLKE